MALFGLIVPFTADVFNAVLTTLLVDCVTTSDGTKFEPPPLLKLTASPGATSPMSTPTAPALRGRIDLQANRCRIHDQSARCCRWDLRDKDRRDSRW